MILTLNEVTELKKIIENRFSARLHFHDGCGGQYFTVDEPNDELKAFLTEYLSERKLEVRFSENGFTVEEISQC
ncbi:MAG: hypothetical protein ACI4MC_05815 [Candidatus Coproplasma sp.]